MPRRPASTSGSGGSTTTASTWGDGQISSWIPGASILTTPTTTPTITSVNPTAPTMESPFFNPGAGFGDSDERVRDAEIAQAWEALTSVAFGLPPDELPFPGNWWPGLEAPNPSDLIRGVGIMNAMLPFDVSGLLPAGAQGAMPEPWAYPGANMDFWDPETRAEDNVYVRYDPTRAAQQFWQMDNATRAEFNTLMANAGLIDEAWENLSDYSLEGASAFAEVLQMANYYGINAKQVLQRAGALAARQRGRRGGGGGGRGPQVKLEVPDYDTLLVDAENFLQSKVGRDIDEWEMALIADHMQERYGQWADAKKRAILGGNGTYEIPDPVKLTEAFVEDKYAAEISRIEDTAELAQTNNLLINNATRGLAMLGGIGGGLER